VITHGDPSRSSVYYFDVRAEHGSSSILRRLFYRSAAAAAAAVPPRGHGGADSAYSVNDCVLSAPLLTIAFVSVFTDRLCRLIPQRE